MHHLDLILANLRGSMLLFYLLNAAEIYASYILIVAIVKQIKFTLNGSKFQNILPIQKKKT